MTYTYRLQSVLWISIALLGLTGCIAPGTTPASAHPSPSAAAAVQSTAAPVTRSAEPSRTATTATPDTSVTSAAATPDADSTATVDLIYFWPEYIPDGLVLNTEQSWADEQGLRLLLQDPTDAQRTLELLGGRNTPAAARPPAMGSKPAVVRGQPGVSFSTGAGWSLHWDEGGQPYSLGGFFGADELLYVAQQLAAADLQTWRQRLAAEANVSPSPTGGQAQLTYFWPSKLPAGFAIQPEKSTMDASSFVVEVTDTGSGQFSFSLVGGATSLAIKPPSSHNRAEVTVRGQPGQDYTTGAGYSVFWQENGQPYAIIGGLGLDQALEIAEALEPMDQAAWQARRAAQ